MKSRFVSVLGCGWLGRPLAAALRKAGASVRGSSTTPSKMTVLASEGIQPFLLAADPDLRGDNLSDFFSSETLVVTLPFRRDFEDPAVYLQQLRGIVRLAGSSAVKSVVFTSSTSVYPDTLALAREDSDFAPDNPRSRVLLEAEGLFLHDPRFEATVVRFAGLCGAGRPVGRFLAGKQDVPGGDRPVNLIHQQDGVAILLEIIRRDIRGEILNACCDGHPTRRELYTQAARKMGLSPPAFREEGGLGPGKVVSNDKLKKRLEYRFLYPDPREF
ncbi:MAG: SDR family oxidoreductase [Candidatus Omnitrophota bacterium]|nr:SDR family oxidoreductase [Candidatus Omnitrophota bacterium]MDZ4242798.1 SDR family oxidoreductase [Candidatus Omnitrophota bacterium]